MKLQLIPALALLPVLLAAGAVQAQPTAAEQAVRRASAEFAQAFARGDARAVAGFWTENGEFHPPGAAFVGRSAIEKAYAAFFKDHPHAKVDVLVESIRFPTPELAVEEGVLRLHGSGKDLPSTSLYSVIHVRQQDRWLIAVAREWGAGQDRLEDLDWLLGRWQARSGDEEVTMTFARDPRQHYVRGSFSRKDGSKTSAAGTLRIGIDPRRGQLRSWHFDEDGGHGQAVWIRDGNRWLLETSGVLGNGSETAAINVLARVGDDEFTWRSIDRLVNDQSVPDTIPIKLRRVSDKGDKVTR
jgi:uncharacterized protein (TIGR02246 family)